MHVSLQMPSRLRSLVELALVLGLAALIYGLGITTDNTALGLVSIAAAWVVILTLQRRRGAGWGEFGLHRPSRWKRTLALTLLGVVVLHVLILILKPLLWSPVT